MEGVGARLGRSSTRYGPATVFSGPVRKWKKRWVHVTPPSSSSNHINTHSHHHNATSNGTAAANNSNSSNGNNGSHLLLYKWTPLSQSNGSSSSPATNNGNSGIDDNKNNANLANGDAPDEPPRRKFKYIPDKELEIQLYKYLILENTVVQHQNLYKCNHPHVPSYVQQGFGNWNALKLNGRAKALRLIRRFGHWELLDLYTLTYQEEKGYGERYWELKFIVHYFGCLTTQVDLLEKQKKEAEEQEAEEKVDDESKLNETDPLAELVSRSDSAEEKPDINDIPMEENEDDNQVVRQDLNESTLDLSLGLVS
ncbi:hypothetical protein DKX38_016880 [Salix brachista]|uniref:Uncharacterized protein n=1 Tax=Salix brachista TaxID=2182728 RepID=A0A5N5KTS3_9ROSI|nr:hypothetical protein DKX38_016880 [Salix brachista]